MMLGNLGDAPPRRLTIKVSQIAVLSARSCRLIPVVRVFAGRPHDAR